MIKLLDFKTIASHELELTFSDHTHGVFDGANYLSSRQGPLLEILREPAYFARCFVDAGALCVPTGWNCRRLGFTNCLEVRQRRFEV